MFSSSTCTRIMHLSLTNLATLALTITTTLAWSDSYGDVPQNSFSLLIKKALTTDSYQGYNNSIYTSLNTQHYPDNFTPKNQFIVRGNQCFQYVGLPPRDDLDSTPDIKIGLDHCRNLGSSDISLFYKDEEISVSNDDRCEPLSGNDEGGFRCILEA
ncbi:hypothetical protein E3P77_01328 [Wallemia ichthyophaga]|uniref:Uncharacterized protein n=1 Tax=Wallemia ichthyophaga TaxID=245174 RepID=A0A4V4M9B1_WALIC|nr:hypothetical protein E3P98_00968 [Wallemia ichthyophaga]TIA92046.1 hypothetical protein E3P97_01656 [Wallemia ichthyophaga]TIA97038.1 hypothetical protein E3P96_03487 [Wallemia ichthyophaga]TIB27955.1 hypothetical protein E3P86_03963 [Wallemia ichthyophaga]TIB33524.1 hypothetical protein E3P85_01308 [Wallemia ichthyophaga]